MRIATWNVNSIRSRVDRVEAWLERSDCDVLAIQETKANEMQFPMERLSALGYEVAHQGLNQWNGVAILSRVGLGDVVNNFAGGGDPDPDARIITAVCGGIRVSCVYVPNGRSLDDAHYQYKLRWLAQLRSHIAALSKPTEQVIVTGDFNIAPTDLDVYDPKKFIDATHVSPAERAELAALCDWGMTDLFRQHHSEAKLYSWWDYRAGDFHQGRGLRIDLVLGTNPVAQRCEFAIIDRNARKGQSPSDHAPVIVDLS